MTDPKDQERNDFRPMEYRGDFSDPRVQQPGDEPAEETGLPSPDSE